MRQNLNYQKTCQKLLGGLSARVREVIVRRFGLDGRKGETLEAIGKEYRITRERVRQIERDGLMKLRLEIKEYPMLVKPITDALALTGGLRSEEDLLKTVGGDKFQNHVYFVLNLGEQFVKFPESENYNSSWALKPESFYSAQKMITEFENDLKKKRQPVNLSGYQPLAALSADVLMAYLAVSKKIKKGPSGMYGLKDWPEISPRGVRDKAYLALKKANEPLHFSEVAKRIGDGALAQTVHNELIKDNKFVLVGRGLYGLKEWGYEPGVVKDVIARVIKSAKKPLSKEEIVTLVTKQRFVKENTITFNLSNRRNFYRTSDGKYQIQES